MIRKYYTRGDAILSILLIVLSLASIAWIHTISNGGKHVVVEVNGRLALELSLDRNVSTTVEGPLGKTVISVKDKTVSIQDSPCPRKYCVKMGKISHRGEIIVCVPNRVVVSIRGGGRDSDSFDGVTQ